MPYILGLIGCTLVAIHFYTQFAKPNSALEDEFPYYAKKAMSAPEQILYFRLVKSLPEHVILAQVGLSRLLGVKKGYNFAAHNNRINRMSADFVVCAKDASVIAVIKLDDASHEREQNRLNDAKKDRALGAASIRVIRWHVRSMPDEAIIREEFSAHPTSSASYPASHAIGRDLAA